jgi:hypothetical protein
MKKKRELKGECPHCGKIDKYNELSADEKTNPLENFYEGKICDCGAFLIPTLIDDGDIYEIVITGLNRISFKDLENEDKASLENRKKVLIKRIETLEEEKSNSQNDQIKTGLEMAIKDRKLILEKIENILEQNPDNLLR